MTSSQRPPGLSLAWRSTLAVLATASCLGIFSALVVLSGTARGVLVVALIVLEFVLVAARAIEVRRRMLVNDVAADAFGAVFTLFFTAGTFGGLSFFVAGDDGAAAVLSGIAFGVFFTAIMWLTHRSRSAALR